MTRKINLDNATENDLRVFDDIAERLKMLFDHTELEAVNMINIYLSRFTDQKYCSQYKISVQTTKFFHWRGPLEMVARIQYYAVLEHEPDERAFTRWMNDMDEQDKLTVKGNYFWHY